MGLKRSFLADFHVHSNLSDGQHDLCDVIDFYGNHGFGAIAITDHIAENDTFVGKAAKVLGKALHKRTFEHYVDVVEQERQRAWDQYGMIVITGFELSKNSLSNHRSAHILGIGVREYVAADPDPVDLIDAIHEQGGVAIAAHPVSTRKLEKQTYHLWSRKEELADRFDAWEVASGPYLFSEVAQEKLPLIASSDLHHKKQMRSWKTQLHCELKEEAILDCIRKQQLDFVFYDRQIN